MDIPLNAKVFCSDGQIGRSTNIILNPENDVITHLVVRLEERPHTEYLVSTKLVRETTPTSIHLDCTSQALKAEDPFVEPEFIPVQIPQYEGVYVWPTSTSKTKLNVVYHHHIPLHETAVEKGAHIQALDGEVGRVEEFLTNSEGHITHLIMRSGPLWAGKDVAIPVSAVSSIEPKTIQLDLDKRQIKKLPLVPDPR